jgi:hypothetical protein
MIELSEFIGIGGVLLFLVLKLFRVGTLKSLIASLFAFLVIEGMLIALIQMVGDKPG